MAEVGRVLGGRYRLVELLGQGGMATIFRAQDDQLGRDVAVKVLRAEYGTDAAFIARFRQEAQSAAALSHPNIVNVFDFGTDQAGPFIVMELVTGGDLAQVLRDQGPLPAPATARVAQQIADALAAAHSRGIVHRDIKPSNVLLTSGGRVKVGDFGIAQAFSEAQLTMPGMTMGSVHYFSPEQARGEAISPASDVYSLGLVMFEMLTGQRAWGGDTAASVAMARLSGGVPSPAAVAAGVSPDLDGICRWTLSPDPTSRPTAAQLSAELERHLAAPAGPAVTAPAMTSAAVTYIIPPNDPPPPADSTSTGRWGWIAAVLGLLVLVSAGVLLFLLIGGGRPDPGTSPTPRLVTVPRLVGLSVADAQSTAGAAQLVMSIGAYETNDEAPAESVVAQDPAASTQLAVGGTVTVVVATPSATVVVPDLRGLTEAVLVERLLEADLQVGVRLEPESDPEVARDLVLRTDPRGGLVVAKRSVVDYVLSSGPEPTLSPSPEPSPSPSPEPSPSPSPEPSPSPSPSPEPTLSPSPEPTLSPSPEPSPSPSPEPTPSPTVEPTPTLSPSPEPTPSGSLEPSPGASGTAIVGNYTASCQDLGTTGGQLQATGLTLGAVTTSPTTGLPYDDSWIVVWQDPLPGTEVPVGSGVDLIIEDPTAKC